MLGADGDPALALEVVAVHHAFVDMRVLAEHVGGAEDAVDQRRLAVVDVGDDGEVTDLVDGVHEGFSLSGWLVMEAGPAAAARRPNARLGCAGRADLL